MRVGDLIPTWVLDDEGAIVGAVTGIVSVVHPDGSYEIEYPDGRVGLMLGRLSIDQAAAESPGAGPPEIASPLHSA